MTKEVGYGRFSVELLFDKCYMARLDLSEDDGEWIAAMRAKNPTRSVGVTQGACCAVLTSST
jgi:hypothetical protein